MYSIKKDKYRKSRGDYSRLLDISCEHCGNHICFYQKDGPGPLRRLYIDRIIDIKPTNKFLKCPSCNRDLGMEIMYKKENRPAYRLFVDAIVKKVISKNIITIN